MSNQRNDELFDRVGDVLDDGLITESQVSVIKTLVHNSDIEGLYWALPKIEQDIKERHLELADEVKNA